MWKPCINEYVLTSHTWLKSIHTCSLALRNSILSQSHKFVCAVLKMSSSCQTNMLRFS